jgi:hypothetical protein
VSLYGHTSPAEFEMANTDRDELEADDGEDLAEGRRNGHAHARIPIPV